MWSTTETQAEIQAVGMDLLHDGALIDTGEWQAIREGDRPQFKTVELQNYVFMMWIPDTIADLVEAVEPNLPFAEAQFLDRVSGQPLNPPPSADLWPWAHHDKEHRPEGKFSHTYPERFWPKHAGQGYFWHHADGTDDPIHMKGIRYAYGDLNDVVNLLAEHPHTRQAYLPVWFPEDTGAVHGERVPCTLGYHFLLRGGKLDITYFIRSCDYLRYFRDDVYMAARLCQWMLSELRQKERKEAEARDDGSINDIGLWNNVEPGRLIMHICSLHVFEGDIPKMRRDYDD